MPPLAFIHSGIATAAYFDLAVRSCPPSLQGTLMMMGWGVFTLSYRGEDVLGSRIYASNPANGFFYCVIATTLVYTLIFPLILLVPKELIATADGEANPEVEEEVLEEVEGTGVD